MDKFSQRQEEFWFSLLRKEDVRDWWRSELEIIFILHGTGKVYFTDIKTEYAVGERDIFVINGLEMQILELDEDAVALSLSVTPEFITSVSPEILKYKIDCRSFLYGEEKQEPFDVLRSDLARAFQNQYKNANTPYFKSRMAAVLEDLSRYFLDTSKPDDNKGKWEFLKTLVTYIQHNYRENITLEDLAKQTYLSKTYISHSFTKCFGISFMEYLTQVRLSHAIRQMQGNAVLTDIAYDSGFLNVNAMIHAFKKYRGTTPGEYRKTLERERSAVRIEEEDGQTEKDVFSSLMQYAKAGGKAENPVEKVKEISVDINGRKQRVPLHWKRIMNAGYAKSLTDGTIQKEIKYLQEKVGFEYIRIKGVLDDDMCLLRRDMNGNIIMNYAYVDEVIEFILSVDAKPMLELGNMPQLLAKNSATQSMRGAAFSAPEDILQWQTLIELLVEHLSKRFGSKQVRSFLFAPWIPPDFIDFGLCSLPEYEQVYCASYRAIKAVNQNYLITGPGSPIYGRYLEWYLKMCTANQCMPDVITFRSYAGEMAKQEENGLKLIGNNESFPMAVSRDENFLRHEIKEIRNILQKKGLSHIPLVLEEWSNNVWQRDLCNDTCFKSAYLFKNILENNDSLNAMGYFTLNDRIDEVPPTGEMFHGGFGLFTKNDIPKSACRAMELLGQMGDRLLQKDEGYFITQRGKEIQIFLYNYSHYDLLYCYRHAVNMSRTNRYQVFVPKEPQAFYIHLENAEAGQYEIRRYGITKEGGSSYDAWVKMGALEPLDEQEEKMLRSLSEPVYRKERVEVTAEETALCVRASLKPLDVWLLKIKMI